MWAANWIFKVFSSKDISSSSLYLTNRFDLTYELQLLDQINTFDNLIN